MIKIFLLGTAMWCGALLCYGQDSTKTSNPYKHDIGFSTNFLLNGIFNSSGTPFTLVYKKYTSDYKATRFGTDLFLNYNNLSGSANYYTSFSSGTFQLSFGREFQKPINTRWCWYFGGDIYASYIFQNIDTYLNGDINQENKDTRYGIGFRPFLAARFNINSRLYISAEASLSLGYYSQLNKYKYIPQPEDDVELSEGSFSIATRPASGIFLFYRF